MAAMATTATTAPIPLDSRGVVTNPGDTRGPVSLEPTIGAILGQQADANAKLALLLPPRNDLNAKAELENLRHKLRALRTFADDHQLLGQIPVLSEIEEARLLQYQVECIESVCLEHGHNFHDQRLVNTLGFLHHADAPSGFSDWLRKNFLNYDPAVRSRNMKRDVDFQPRNNGLGVSYRRHFFKCADENCIHYIYGFSHPDELDQHRRLHVSRAKRDSGLSVGGPASTPFLPEAARGLLPNGPKPSSPTRLLAPESDQSSSLQLPPLVIPSPEKGSRKSFGSLPFYPELPNLGGAQYSVGEGADPLLPPLKRSRVGPSRLESIGELRLLQDVDTCLRCRLLNGECDSAGICALCHANNLNGGMGDFWQVLGCRRGPLSGIVDILVPDFLGPGRAHTPMTSPLAKRHDMNDYLERLYPIQTDAVWVVKTNLDFDDGFWWTEDLAVLPSADPARASFGFQAMARPPPVLRVLASCQSMAGTAYNFWQLLKLSGLLSSSRHAEALLFPYLFRAKLLLREVLFFDLQQPESSIATDTPAKVQLSTPDEFECYSRHRTVATCMVQFLDSIEHLTAHGDPASPRQWLAAFFSVCIFSIARTILVNMALLWQSRVARPFLGTGTINTDKMHAAYKAAVAALGSQLSTLFDCEGPAMPDEDKELYNTASMIVKRSIWRDGGILSTGSFLLSLGSLEMEGGVWHGFLRQATPRRNFEPPPKLFNMTENSQPTRPALLPTQQPGTGPWPETNGPRDANLIYATSNESFVVSPQSAISDGTRSRVENDGPCMDGALFSQKGSHSPLSPVHVPKANAAPQRFPPHRFHCKTCNEYPDGFCAEHELRRHTDAKLAGLTKRWICTTPSDISTNTVLRPAIPISRCTACVTGKKYGTYYSAAAHLRREHFSPRRIRITNSEWPSMATLKDWIQEVHVPPGTPEDPISSDGEDDPSYSLPEYVSQVPDIISPPRSLSQFTTVPAVNGQAGTSAHSPVQAPLAPRTLQAAPARTQLAEMNPPQEPVPGLAQIPPAEVSTKEDLPLQPQQLPQPPPAPQVLSNTGQLPSSLSVTFAASAEKSHHIEHGQKPVTVQSPPSSSNARAEDQRHSNRNRCPHPECGRVFKDLAAHMLTHMEERPEKCPIESCEYHTKGFARKYDKNRHALTHYKGTMVCPFCHGAGTVYEKAFNRADVFKRHLTAVHNVEQTPPNSKKATVTTGGHRLATISGENNKAMCSICRSQFLTAQEFYEHLDDCVLNVIVPVPGRATGTPDTNNAGTPPSDTKSAATTAFAIAATASQPPQNKLTGPTKPSQGGGLHSSHADGTSDLAIPPGHSDSLMPGGGETKHGTLSKHDECASVVGGYRRVTDTQVLDLPRDPPQGTGVTWMSSSRGPSV